MSFLSTHRFWMSVCAGLALTGLAVGQRITERAPTIPTVGNSNQDSDDTEVLARGPIHEAFATTAEMPTDGGPVVEKRPPDPVEELPPDQKPDGDNVQWIPGYWHYDEERKDFIWISGFWRDAPPGRTWVSGGWREVRRGYQWVHGFWNLPQAKQAEWEYLPPPPVTLENGPTILAPTETCFYTPGSWVYQTNRFRWRPGFWVEHRRDWIWVPDTYRWTPMGYVFVTGYWDVPLARRGVLFAPVAFRQRLLARRNFVYTPVYVVPEPALYTSLFVRSGYSSYYFGDYYEQSYVTAGYSSWSGVGFGNSNFGVNIDIGRQPRPFYDPLWSYYSIQNRAIPAWQTNINNVYVGRFNGDVPRPPRTLIQQNNTTVVNNVNNVNNVTNVTNVTNTTNNTVINNKNNNNRIVNNTPVVAPALLAPLTEIKTASPGVALKTLVPEDRIKEQKLAKDFQLMAAERKKVETNLVDKGLAVTKDDKPRMVKFDVPPTISARAQAPTEPAKAPPPPPAPASTKVTNLVNPGPIVKQAPKPDAPKPTPPAVTLPVEAGRPNRGETKPPVAPAPIVAKPAEPAKPVQQPVMPKPETPKPPTPVVQPPKPEAPKPVTPVTPRPDPTKPRPVEPKPDAPKPPAPVVQRPKVEMPKPPAPVVQPPKQDVPKVTNLVPTTRAPKPQPMPQAPPPTVQPPKTSAPLPGPVTPSRPRSEPPKKEEKK